IPSVVTFTSDPPSLLVVMALPSWPIQRPLWKARAGSIPSGLVVLAHLVRPIEDRARALDYSGFAGVEAGRRHTSGVRRLRATGLANSVAGNAIEAESREQIRAGNQCSLVDRPAYRGRVGRLAQTPVNPALGDGIFIHRVVKDRVYIYEVHSEWY